LKKDKANSYQITQLKKKLVKQFKTTVWQSRINDALSASIICLFFFKRCSPQKPLEMLNQCHARVGKKQKPYVNKRLAIIV